MQREGRHAENPCPDYSSACGSTAKEIRNKSSVWKNPKHIYFLSQGWEPNAALWKPCQPQNHFSQWSLNKFRALVLDLQRSHNMLEKNKIKASHSLTKETLLKWSPAIFLDSHQGLFAWLLRGMNELLQKNHHRRNSHVPNASIK